VFWRKRNKDANGEVKMFFASDLHGSNVCFKKFVNSAKFYGVDVLVLGGDVLSAQAELLDDHVLGDPTRRRHLRSGHHPGRKIGRRRC